MIEPRRESPHDEEAAMSPKTKPQDRKTPKRGNPARKATTGFTDEERAAIREYAKEKRAAAKGGASAADGEADVLKKIAEMSPSDRQIAKKIHAIVKENAPELAPRTWYGMPAYAKDGKVV